MNGRAAELREAFDRSFAVAASAQSAAVENLLGIRIGAHRYALRLVDVSGLFTDKKVTSLPGPVAELLGIAGFRGAVLPIYDLGMLLGRSRAVAPRWLVVAAAAPLGLAFEAFDGYLSVGRDAIAADARAKAVKGSGWDIARTEVARPIIDVPSVVERIRIRCGRDRQT